jgi:hypothetical protein
VRWRRAECDAPCTGPFNSKQASPRYESPKKKGRLPEYHHHRRWRRAGGRATARPPRESLHLGRPASATATQPKLPAPSQSSGAAHTIRFSGSALPRFGTPALFVLSPPPVFTHYLISRPRFAFFVAASRCWCVRVHLHAAPRTAHRGTCPSAPRQGGSFVALAAALNTAA